MVSFLYLLCAYRPFFSADIHPVWFHKLKTFNRQCKNQQKFRFKAQKNQKTKNTKKKSTIRFITIDKILNYHRRLSTFGNAHLTKHPKWSKEEAKKNPTNQINWIFFLLFSSLWIRLRSITIVSDRLNKHSWFIASNSINHNTLLLFLFFLFFLLNSRENCFEHVQCE